MSEPRRLLEELCHLLLLQTLAALLEQVCGGPVAGPQRKHGLGPLDGEFEVSPIRASSAESRIDVRR